MSGIHVSRQGYITKSTLPSVSRQRGGATITPELMIYGENAVTGIVNDATYTDLLPEGSSITATGNPTRTNFSPFTTTGSSLEFDGTNDYIQIPYFSDLSLGATYTIEMWIYPRAFPAANIYTTLFNIANANTTSFGYVSLEITNGFIWTSTRPSTGAALVTMGGASTTAIGLNTWSHIALVVNSTAATLYINGVSGGTATFTALNGTQTFCSMGYWNNGYTTSTGYYNGYISNFRVVKGTAVYTSNFFPRREELGVISGTILYIQPGLDATPGNRQTILDSSSNNYTVTTNGDARQSKLSPFNQVPNTWSTYFDGTGDYLLISDYDQLDMENSDLTMECWYYSTSTPNGGILAKRANGSIFGGVLISFGNKIQPSLLVTVNGSTWGIATDSSIGITLGAWNHIAVTRSGTTWRLFVNGAVGLTATLAGTVPNNTAAFSIGAGSADGGQTITASYISNVRVVKGTALYTSNFTPPTEPLTAVTNTVLLTCQDNLINDNSITLPTGLSTYSAYFDGTGDYVSVANGNNTPFDLGTGNFNVEFWFYKVSGTTAGLWDTRTLTSQAIPYIYLDTGGIRYYVSGTNQITGSTIQNNLWYHVALSRQTGTTRLFLNGILQGTYSDTNTYTITPNQIRIGNSFNAAQQLHGYISNFRIVKGTALYTSNFTPPTEPLTAISDTSLLILQGSTFVDTSVNNHTITTSGDAKTVLTTESKQIVTRNGDVSSSRFNPLSCTYTTNLTRGSTYFDGTGDYLSIASNAAFDFGAGDFTAEAWIYTNTVAAGNGIIIGRQEAGTAAVFQLRRNAATVELLLRATGGTGLITVSTPSILRINTWIHIAAVRSGSTITIYIDGLSRATGTSTTNPNPTAARPLTIGVLDDTTLSGYFNGYISNLRVIKGTAVYTANFTPPTEPLTSIANTSVLLLPTQYDNPQEVIDSSQFNHIVTTVGQATHSLIHPFSAETTSGSIYFDGTGDYLSTSASSSAFEFGTGAFTIECWIYFPTALPNNTFQCIFSYGESDNDPRYVLYYDSRTAQSSPGLRFTTINGGSAYIDVIGGGLSGWAANTWYHVAVTRDGNTFKLFRNGVQTGNTVTDVDSIVTSASCKAFVGSEPAAPLAVFSGYISNLRVIKGTALYTATFIAPTQPLTNTAGTTLLLNTANTNSFQNTATNKQPVIGMNGIAESTQSYLLNTSTDVQGTYYFDGTDYLNINSTSSSTFALGTGNFTIEFWVNTNSASANMNFVDFRTTTSTGAYLTIYQTGSTLRVWINGAVAITGSILPANHWQHVALTRSGTSTRLFLNGVQTGSTYTDTINYLGATNRPVIGSGFDGTNSLVGWISNLRILKGTALYTANFTPPNQPLVPITNTSALIATNNGLATPTVFFDTSGNYFPISVNGDVTQTQFSPFQDQYLSGSAYFDGTGDYLTIPNNSAFDFGSGNLTIEQWVYPTSLGAERIISSQWFGGTISQTAWTIDFQATNKIRVMIGSGSSTQVTINSTSTFSANAWYHVAVVRSGTTITLYVNGVSEGSVTLNGVINNLAYPVYIGALNNGGTPISTFIGYISNFRVVKGTALYTANFTPPTQPLTAVTNTSLLLPTNNYGSTPQDTSANRFPIRVFGDTRTVGFNPFNSSPQAGSYYFDGTGDYLTVPSSSELTLGTQDHTIEFWLYLDGAQSAYATQWKYASTAANLVTDAYWFQAGSNGGGIYTLLVGAGGSWGVNISAGATYYTRSLNNWTHVAWSRSGSTWRLFWNGEQVGTATYSGSIAAQGSAMAIGTDSGTYNTKGYISNFRLVKGTALYTQDFAVPTQPLTAITNTQLLLTAQNWTIEDSSLDRHKLQRYGTPKLTVTEYPTGGQSSIYFDGVDDYIGMPGTFSAIGTSSFCIEFWIKPGTNSSTSRVMGNMVNTTWGTNRWTIGTNNGSNKLFFEVYNYNTSTPMLVSTSNFNDNTWKHVAIVKTTGTTNYWTLYVNGVQEAQVTSAISLDGSSEALKYVGWSGNSNHTDYQGYLSNVRVTIGTGIYANNNVVPPTTFVPVAPLNNTGSITNNVYGVYQLI